MRSTHEFIEESGTMNAMFVINGKLGIPTNKRHHTQWSDSGFSDYAWRLI
jgi:hypothetical protein